MCLLDVREHLYFYPLVCPKQRKKLPSVTSASTNRGCIKAHVKSLMLSSCGGGSSLQDSIVRKMVCLLGGWNPNLAPWVIAFGRRSDLIVFREKK